MTDHPRSPGPFVVRDEDLRHHVPDPMHRAAAAELEAARDASNRRDAGLVDGCLYVAPWPPGSAPVHWTPIGDTIDPVTFGQTRTDDDIEREP